MKKPKLNTSLTNRALNRPRTTAAKEVEIPTFWDPTDPTYPKIPHALGE